MTTTQTIEERVALLETELARINQLIQSTTPQPLPASHPWWNTVFGVFADCPAFDEVEEFGRNWRNSQPDDVE